MTKASSKVRHRRRSRILIVITDLDVGGAEKCCTQVAIGLDRSRWSPAVCCLTPTGRLGERLEAAGIPTYSLKVANPWQVPIALLRLVRLMHQLQPDIVHTFLFHANLLGRVAGSLIGVPRLVSSIRVAERRFRYHLVAENLLCRLSDKVLCVSEAVAQYTRIHSHVPGRMIEVIPNGIDVAHFAGPDLDRSSIGLATNSVAALFVGRLDPQKGVDLLLHALAIASGRCPALRLLLAGDGPARDSLRALARELRIDHAVQFLGWREDIAALMRSVDLFVIPSRWEGMPNAILEAMAARLPVVATRAEGSTELVREGRTGRLVGIDQPAELADALVELVENESLRRRWGEEGYKVASSEYSLARMLSAYEHLYETLLAE